MKPLRKYEIPFVGLKRGKHLFTYNVDASFFEHFEDAPIKEGNIEIDLYFDKANFFMLEFQIHGNIPVICDRCSEPFDLELDGQYMLIVKYDDDVIPGEAPDSENEDILYISRNETHVNVANQIYEFIVLSIPMQKMHPDDENDEPGCQIKWDNGEDKEKSTDPRWDALKDL